MPFPRRLLNEGEDVVLDLRPHWWVLVQPVAVVVVAVAVLLVVATRIDNDLPTWAALVLLLVSLLRLLVAYLRWVTTNFVVTTDRIVYRVGVLAKAGRDIPLERMNDIAVEQSILERIVGAGDLMIESAGELGQSHFT